MSMEDLAGSKEKRGIIMRKKTILTGIMTVAVLILSACGNKGESQLTDSSAVQDTVSTEEESVPETLGTVEESVDALEESTGGSEEMLTGTYPDGSTPAYSGVKLKLTVDGEEIIIAMYDNTAVDAFLERLPLEDISFFDLSGIEKPIQQPDEPFSLGDEESGYDPVAGEMVIYRPWGNFTIFYGDFRHSDELVPLGKVESGLEILAGKEEDFTGTLERME